MIYNSTFGSYNYDITHTCTGGDTSDTQSLVVMASLGTPLCNINDFKLYAKVAHANYSKCVPGHPYC